MERQFVTSTGLQSVGYDTATGILKIEFRNGGIYRYSSISFSVYQAFMHEVLKGTFFHSQIKDRYPMTRIR